MLSGPLRDGLLLLNLKLSSGLVKGRLATRFPAPMVVAPWRFTEPSAVAVLDFHRPESGPRVCQSISQEGRNAGL
jgi:hypothetical protein